MRTWIRSYLPLVLATHGNCEPRTVSVHIPGSRFPGTYSTR